MSFDPKGRRYCDCCGRFIEKPHRIEGRDEYCATCYAREFVPRTCACGKASRILRSAPPPYRCKSCVVAARTCIRCDRPVPRAGLRVGNGVVCPICYPKFAAKAACESCGQLSGALNRRAGDPDAPRLCQRCSTADTHATCVHCGRHRRIQGRTEAGRPYCEPCGPQGVLCHACPECGVLVRGLGSGRCRACLNSVALDREVELQVLTLNREDCRSWLRGFAKWLHARAPDDPGLVGDLSRHLPFFERLDTLLEGRPTCTAEWMLETFPVRELRRHVQVMGYLEEQVGIVLSDEAKKGAAERERIAELLRHSRAAPFGAVIHSYAHALAARGCKLLTQRQYLSAAVAFCSAAQVANDGWSHDAPTRFLRRHAGQRLNLRVFLRFCEKEKGWTSAGLPPETTPSAPSRTAQRFRDALKRLEHEGDNARAHDIARVLGWAFALSPSEMGTARIELRSKSVFLVTADGHHRVPKALHPLAMRWREANVP